jgi:6-phosphofructokinase
MEDRKDQVLLGDDFLKREIYKATMERINTQKLKKIVIVGGSHSGFSAAWLMLNGPATYKRMNSLH